MKYRIKKKKILFNPDAVWDMPPWQDIPALTLTRYMGTRPDHFPLTEVKIISDGQAVFVMFRVKDQYVRAVAEHHQDKVFEDSCVEFFFTPGTDVLKGYFNLEMNCRGIMLFHFQTKRGENRVVIPEKDCEKIVCTSSWPGIADPEIKTPVTWTVCYRIPVSLLESYTEVFWPGPGVQWRANFYKCGDKTSHPHWLTWEPMEGSAPDFHRPECFGILEFE